MAASTTTLEHIHACMSDPGFQADNDGYALPAEVAKASRRNPGVVLALLHYGLERGLFESRPHPTLRHNGIGQPLREYKAVGGHDISAQSTPRDDSKHRPGS